MGGRESRPHGELGVDGPITPEVLYAAGVTRGLEFPVKVLGGGELSRHWSCMRTRSRIRQGAIEAQGGSISELTRTDDG
jgi:ribosomal protein L15